MKKNSITIIVLTLNEGIHLKRCLQSAKLLTEKIIVVDSFSSDQTLEIIRNEGVQVFQNNFVNYASQFNWALKNCDVDSEWVFRLDADEYLTDELVKFLPEFLNTISRPINGVSLNLRRVFMGKWLKHGSLYPIKLTRLWRYGCGKIEERWMDEHLLIDGEVIHAPYDFVDCNLNPIGWWVDKHNKYASREVVDLLNIKYGFIGEGKGTSITGQAGKKRWIKEKVYSALPLGLRAFAYFLYRYIFRMGFLDGKEGLIFHILQGFWYRYLVDVKMYEVLHLINQGYGHQDAISKITGICFDDGKRE